MGVNSTTYIALLPTMEGNTVKSLWAEFTTSDHKSTVFADYDVFVQSILHEICSEVHGFLLWKQAS